jgi:hypothetical protein
VSDGFDLSGLDRLAADLTGAGNAILPFAATALGRTSMNVKKTWRGKVSGARGMPGLAAAVSYDVTTSGGAVEAEIGYDKSRYQGPLGNISEYGSPTHAPRGYGAAALQENTDDFVHGINAAVGDALKARGL